MTDPEAEKRARTQNLDAIAEVTSWRLPDVVFDERTEVDLGGRTVQLWHFGPGNSPGETVVWVAEARAAWTGNLLGHRRVVPMLLEGGPVPYIDTLARFKSTLAVKTIVPGHGPLADARSLDAWMTYLRELLEAVTRAPPARAERPGHRRDRPAAPRARVSALAPGRPHELAGPRSAPAQRPGHLSGSRAPAHRSLSSAARRRRSAGAFTLPY
jgi:glyoxylase-like metal-dependent hydrolase (beta-lactamase superfamily II)